jgi:hypothetical protein
MTNHVYLLLKTGLAPIATVMRRFRMLCYLAARKLMLSCTEVARELNISPTAVSRAANIGRNFADRETI